MVSKSILCRMRPRRWHLFHLLLAGVLSLIPAADLAATSDEAIAVIAGFAGEVVVRRASERDREIDWQRDRPTVGTVNIPIGPGDAIITRRGTVILDFIKDVSGLDKEAVEVGPKLVSCRLDNSTEVVFEAWASGSRSGPNAILFLEQGEVRCTKADVEQRSPTTGRMDMIWKAGRTSVRIQHTDVKLTYLPAGDRLTVTVFDGRVVVAGPRGSRIVEAGQTVRFIRGVPEGAPPA